MYVRYGLDAEWDSKGNLMLACVYDIKTGQKITLRPGDKPIVLEGRAAYYFAMEDYYLTTCLVSFTEGVVDANLLYGCAYNESTHAEGIGAKLQNRVWVRYNQGFEHQIPNEKKAVMENVHYNTVLAHCREDAYWCALIGSDASKWIAHYHPERFAVVEKCQSYMPFWHEMTSRGYLLDADYLNRMCNVKATLDALKAPGFDIDWLTLDAAGKVHQDMKKTQAWLRRAEIGDVVPSLAAYREKATGTQIHFTQKYFMPDKNKPWVQEEAMRKLAKVMPTSDTKTLCSLLQSVLYAKRVGNIEFTEHGHHAEVMSQASGRFSPIGSFIAQGGLKRASVIPPEGYFTCVVDLTAEEPCLAASFSGDEVLQDVLIKQDLYSYEWCACTGQPYRNLKYKQPKTEQERIDNGNRNRAKGGIALPHLYGVGAKTMAESMGIEIQAAQTYLARLNEKFCGLAEWKEVYLRDATACGESLTKYHHVPLNVSLYGQNSRQTINHAIQGTGADILREWCTHIDGQLGYRVFSTLHDGIYGYLPLDHRKDGAKELERITNEFLDEHFPLGFKGWGCEAVAYDGRLYEHEAEYKAIEKAIEDAARGHK